MYGDWHIGVELDIQELWKLLTLQYVLFWFENPSKYFNTNNYFVKSE